MQRRLQGVQGAKGSSAPHEASDTLRSTQRAQIVDLLSEGEIGGLVNGLKSIYLDGVPVQNADGSMNFAEFNYRLTLGGPTTEAPHAFGDVQTEVGVGVTVLAAVPVVRTISDTTADAVRVTINVPQLVLNQDNGDRVGAAFEYAIDIQSNGGGYVQQFTEVVSGKASAPYSRAVRLSLTDTGPPPWDVRVRRITADSASASLVNAFAWASYTLISGVRMLYRHRAVIELEFDARNFSSIPSRWYDLLGVSDWEMPVNYDPLARTVAGSWNGTWKLGFTNNPAWVLHNLIRHERYGLGEYVVQLPDKWTLYQLALWCDEQLPDGQGGTEPRYSINLAMVEQREALQLLQDICSVFRGVLMHGGSTLTVAWDAPGDPVASYAPANVVDQLFTYSDASAGAVKTSCTCWYTDRSQAARQIPVTWDDPELVPRFGLRNFEIRPLGVATPAQALRMAKWAVFTAYHEGQTVAFKVGAEGPVRRLGEVFQVTDPSEAGERLGGRISAATTTVVTLDAPVTLAGGETYTLWVTQPHATDPARLVQEGRTVTTGAGTVSVLTVSPAFSAAPLAQTVWLLEGTDVAPTLWRYAGIEETRGDDGQPQYQVLGVRHEPGKWALIEADQPITPRPTRRLPYGAPAVASISITEEVWFDAVGVAHIRATVSWPIPAPGLRYVVRWRVDNGLWHQEHPISVNTIEGNNLAPGVYEVQVQSLNGLGQLSVPTTATATLLGILTVPNPSGLAAVAKLGQVVVSWDEPLPPLLFSSELRVGASWAAGTFLWRGKSTDYKHARPPNGTYKVWLAHCVVRGDEIEYSASQISVDITVDDSIDGGGGVLFIETNRLPYFEFADGTTHTSTTPDLTITARLIRLVGTPVWTAEAFDADVGGNSLGPVTLGGSGLVRTMSAAQFVAPGSAGSVRRVDVTAAMPGAPPDGLPVYRQDPTVTTPRLWLDNPIHPVATDAAGMGGDYSGAYTNALVVIGLTPADPEWDFSIEPDTGLTATVDGGAGPVTDASAVLVAVSDSTIDDGVVMVSATDGVTTLERPFRIVKSKAGSGAYTAYFDPSEVPLPLRADGQVASYAQARSTFHILTANGVPDTPQWTLTKTDIGVTSELVGAEVRITQFLPLGTLGNLVSTALDPATGWLRASSATWCDGVWVAFGYHDSADYSTVLRSADFEAWDEVDTGIDGNFNRGAYGAGKLLAIEAGAASNNRVMRSADQGLTWVLDTLSQSAVWGHIHFGDVWLVASETTTAGSKSADGDSFSNVTMPAAGCQLAFAAPAWGAVTPAGDLHISTDGGSTWSASRNADMDIPAGNEVHRVVGFLGALAMFLRDSSNRMIYTIDGGDTFVTVILPGTYANPRQPIVVRNVLYLISEDLTVYCTADGLTWFEASDPFGAAGSLPDDIYGMGDSADLDYLPALDAGVSDGVPLSNNSLVVQGGADGATTINDLSGYATSAAIAANAAFSDDHTVFGANMLRSTSIDPDIAPFTSVGSTSRFTRQAGEDMTVECYVRWATLAAFSIATNLWYWRRTGDAERIAHLYLDNTGTLQLRLGGTTYSMGSLAANTTHYVKLKVIGDTYYLEVGGTQVGTGAFPSTSLGGTYNVWVGAGSTASSSGPSTAVWVTPLRWTKGVARDGGVPTGPFDIDDTQHALKQQLASTSADTGFVRVRGTKPTETLPIERVLPVRKAVAQRTRYTASVSPPYLEIPATADGVGTDYSNATLTGAINGDGVPDTDNWSVSWTAEHMTPSSGSGPVATFTAMADAVDETFCYFVAEKPGERQVRGAVNIRKAKGTVGSGPIRGSAFAALTFNATYVALRFSPDGTWAIKEGSGGSFVVAGRWAGVVRAENEDYWLMVRERGPDELTSGTTDEWLAMTVNRDYVFEDASPGLHRVDLDVLIAEDDTGAGVVPSTGALELNVPA